MKVKVIELEEKLDTLKAYAGDDEQHFIRFAFEWVENMGNRFLSPELSQDNRLRCKQIIFPDGFHLNKNKKFTPRNESTLPIGDQQKRLFDIRKVFNGAPPPK